MLLHAAPPPASERSLPVPASNETCMLAVTALATDLLAAVSGAPPCDAAQAQAAVACAAAACSPPAPIAAGAD
eukprot:364197-Chlamydomonas_euryale.AAC.50